MSEATILGLPDPVFWMELSGLIFLIMTVLFLAGPFRRDKSELMQGLLGFLAGMGWFNVLYGIGMYTGIGYLNILAVFGAVTGSAFLLKFPLLVFSSESVRSTIFYIVLAVGWLMSLWLLLFPADPMMPMLAGSIFLIIFSGAIGGLYIIWRGFRVSDPASRIKCIGGGASVVFCCLFTHLIVLTIGMTVLAKVFMILTPVTVLLSNYLARLKEPGKPTAVAAN